jgi:hypothetical protein
MRAINRLFVAPARFQRTRLNRFKTQRQFLKIKNVLFGSFEKGHLEGFGGTPLLQQNNNM